MSDIGLIMNVLLGLLLVGALALGWRLEGRLKALRSSHEGFIKAVEDLDRAAARAEQGLADLRAATDEAADTLAARIDRAGALAGRLEKLTAEATVTEARLIAHPRSQPTRAETPRSEPERPAESRESAFARFAERYGAKGGLPVQALAQAAARNDLILEDEAPPPRAASVAAAARIAPEAVARIERLRALARTPAPAASRARAPADDELFDAPAPRRAAGGLR
jgi:hypothetical protein